VSPATVRALTIDGLLLAACVAVAGSAFVGGVDWGDVGRLSFLPYAAVLFGAMLLYRITRALHDERRRRRSPPEREPRPEPAERDARLDAVDVFVVEQKFTVLVNRYRVLADDAWLAAFVEQKRLALREDLRAYTNDGKELERFRIKAQQVFDPAARYRVTDPDGRLIGELQKDFQASLLRSTWRLFDAHGAELAVARERSIPVAVWRRVVDLVPIVGDLLALIPVRYHFDVLRDGERIAEVRRKVGLRDRYVLDLAADAERILDRRLAIALAVGLDALQAR